MGFADDLDQALRDTVRGGGQELILQNAEAVKSEMGTEGEGLTFEYVQAQGSDLESLGTLNVKGPSDEVVQKFHELLRKRMGQ
jgi:hypothetical protein